MLTETEILTDNGGVMRSGSQIDPEARQVSADWSPGKGILT